MWCQNVRREQGGVAQCGVTCPRGISGVAKCGVTCPRGVREPGGVARRGVKTWRHLPTRRHVASKTSVTWHCCGVARSRGVREPRGVAGRGVKAWRQAPSTHAASQDVASIRGVIFKTCLQLSGDMCTPTGDPLRIELTVVPGKLATRFDMLCKHACSFVIGRSAHSCTCVNVNGTLNLNCYITIITSYTQLTFLHCGGCGFLQSATNAIQDENSFIHFLEILYQAVNKTCTVQCVFDPLPRRGLLVHGAGVFMLRRAELFVVHHELPHGECAGG